ncbi:hypothetical protein KVR01_011379 [Diaporthe batatas]|uniref:uncharacterized protein n=1 Tax=Diaporthe batatas TaxID=748121 RepID=UPI001D04646D|nr:uncharacterized protein KVR01_011379 [Diaporthe batatas]KAG8158936.1 hypothetical protein KVR01_011379 [Diaporthe batatas]
MGVSHLLRQGVMPVLVVLGAILAAPHSVMAAECDPQLIGSGPTTTPDTVDAFHRNGVYGGTAINTPVPPGYTVYTNNGQIPFNLYGTWSSVTLPNADFLGWRNLQTYDPVYCSTVCNGIPGCKSFNTFYQRAPKVEPSWNASSPCYNPPSTVQIMCTFWDTPLNMSTIEQNFGWPRGGFQVAIVASKYYNKN